MATTDPSQPAAWDLPPQAVTADQIVAINMRHWRRAGGMTQEELGRRLGWTAANVSAAERSSDPARETRRFNAETLIELALALSVPVTALLLPPPGDETESRYILKRSEGPSITMADFMELVVMPDRDENEDEIRVMDGYRRRFNDAMKRYLAPDWASEAAGYLRKVRSAEDRREMAARLADREKDLLAAAAEMRELHQALAEDEEPR